MPERARAALVVLCDQWKLQPQDIKGLVDAWAVKPQAAVVSAYEGTTGPPAIFPRAMFDRLGRLQGDTGAKKILKRWKGEIITLPNTRAAQDIDTPDDLPA